MRRPGLHPLHRHRCGASLIEALVALAVLAFGVLGMAGLQTRTLLESRATNARAVAVRLASDLSERIQSNPASAPTGHSTRTSLYLMDWDASPAATDCWNRACDASELARFDLMQWKASLSHLLPGGDARVFVSASDPAEIGVLIGWRLIPQPSLIGANGAGSPVPAPPLNAAPGVTGVPCKTGLMCHLVFIRP